MIYCCNKCKFMFENTKTPERCPDCGGFDVRKATESVCKEYVDIKKSIENEKD